MTKIIIIIVALLVILLLLAFRKKQQLKTKAKRCAKEAQLFHDKLQQLSAPSHFFTDEEVKQLKHEFAPLLNEVHQLYDSKLLSHDYLEELGLRRLIDERKFLNHIQLENNRHYKSLANSQQRNDHSSPSH